METVDRRRFMRRAGVGFSATCLYWACAQASDDPYAHALEAYRAERAARRGVPPVEARALARPSRATAGTACFTLSSNLDVEAAPFCLGYAFCPGEVPAPQRVSSDLPRFQATVRNRWPDGSVKFAVLAGVVSLKAGEIKEVHLRAGPAQASGPSVTEDVLKGADCSATLSFAPHGEVELASLIGLTSRTDGRRLLWTAGRVRELIAGPEMSSWLYFSPLGESARLSAWFEVRAWKGGYVEVLPWLENGWLRVPGPTSYQGLLSFMLNGKQRMAQPLTLPHHCRAVAVQGHPAAHASPSSSPVRYAHDTTYLQRTRLVPAYIVNASSALLQRQLDTFEPMVKGDFPAAMGAGGYDRSIGLLPEWDVGYLVSGGASSAFDAVLAHGFAAGRYAIHYRDETTNQPILFSSRPGLCLGDSASLGVSSAGTSARGDYTPPAGGRAPPTWASSHHPSVGYLAYLVSGWFYFAEETQFAATLNYLKQQDVAREGAKGVIKTNAGANTTRGAAWALRTLLQAATVTPDDDRALQMELLASVRSNIDYYHERYVVSRNNPYGICAPYSDYTSGDGKFMHAIWMEDFLTAVWGYAIGLRLPIGDATAARLAAFFRWKARSVIGRLGQPGVANDYDYRDAAQYTLSVAPSDKADFSGGSGPWYDSWGAIHAASVRMPESPAGDHLRGAYFPDPTSYWGNLQPAIAYAVEHGVPGAHEAYRRMTLASNWRELLARLPDHPVWGVGPLSQ